MSATAARSPPQASPRKTPSIHPQTPTQPARTPERLSLYQRGVLSQERKLRSAAEEEAKRSELRNASKISKGSLTHARTAFKKELLTAAQTILGGDPDRALTEQDVESFVRALTGSGRHAQLARNVYAHLSSDFVQDVYLNTLFEWLETAEFASESALEKSMRTALSTRKAKRPQAAPSSEAYLATPEMFQPKLAPASRRLDSARTKRLGIDPSLPREEQIHLERRLRAQRLSEVRLRLAQREVEECTFRPDTRLTASRLPQPRFLLEDKNPNPGARIYEQEMIRKQRLEQRIQAERDKARCSFRPVVHKSPARAAPREIPGFDRTVARLRTPKPKRVTPDTVFEDYKPLEAPIPVRKFKRNALKREFRTPAARPLGEAGSPENITEETEEVEGELLVTLPNQTTVSLLLRKGEAPEEAVRGFGAAHGIRDEDMLSGLLHALQLQQRGGAHPEEEEEEEDEQQEEEELALEVRLQDGRSKTLRIPAHRDVVSAVAEFVEENGLSVEDFDAICRVVLPEEEEAEAPAEELAPREEPAAFEQNMEEIVCVVDVRLSEEEIVAVELRGDDDPARVAASLAHDYALDDATRAFLAQTFAEAIEESRGGGQR